jgi:poly(3-hydroxybutyrate) depolymerase
MRLSLISTVLFLPVVLAQPPAPGRFQRPPDPRAQQRTYHFADTNEDLPYAIYVSSKVSKDKKNPLIIALHGLGGNQNSLVRGNAIDLAEEGGYILVGPMGYNSRGWYGSPLLKPQPGAVPRRPNPEAANDPPNLRELSEKDVMNVLEIVRKEFNVDDHRTYLMGHSMGGAGTLYLGSKYASNWAAIAAIAPAAFAMLPNPEELLKPIKNLGASHDRTGRRRPSRSGGLHAPLDWRDEGSGNELRVRRTAWRRSRHHHRKKHAEHFRVLRGALQALAANGVPSCPDARGTSLRSSILGCGFVRPSSMRQAENREKDLTLVRQWSAACHCLAGIPCKLWCGREDLNLHEIAPASTSKYWTGVHGASCCCLSVRLRRFGYRRVSRSFGRTVAKPLQFLERIKETCTSHGAIDGTMLG